MYSLVLLLTIFYMHVLTLKHFNALCLRRIYVNPISWFWLVFHLWDFCSLYTFMFIWHAWHYIFNIFDHTWPPCLLSSQWLHSKDAWMFFMYFLNTFGVATTLLQSNIPFCILTLSCFYSIPGHSSIHCPLSIHIVLHIQRIYMWYVLSLWIFECIIVIIRYYWNAPLYTRIDHTSYTIVFLNMAGADAIYQYTIYYNWILPYTCLLWYILWYVPPK